MANEQITFDKLPQAVGYLTEQMEQIRQMVAALQPQTSSDKHRLVEIDEACKITRKAKPTIYTLARKGLIPAYKRGKKLYFYEDELLQWIESGRKQMQAMSLQEQAAEIVHGAKRKPKVDQESCIYADKVRSLRQKEYDNASLYSETDAEQAEQLERSRCNFIEYFDHVQRLRHAHSSDSIIINWKRVHELLKIFAKGDTILFSQIDLKLIESFRMFLLNAPQGGGKKGVISQNTASTYFSIFKAALKQAFIDGYLTVDIRAKIKGIQGQESRREYLTIEELNRLAQTPCGPLLKRAALFSALTGLRHCDIQKLKWSEIEVFNGGYRLNFTQQKTKGVEYMPISEQAFQLCGERKDGEQLVFAGLPDPSWINRPIKKWVAEAGITKHITYHCARHSVFSFSLKFNSLQNISA